MVKKLKASGLCLFCGEGGMSKQHVWPAYLRDLLFKDGEENHHLQFQMFTQARGDLVMLQPELQFAKGPARARKIRKFCERCNNTWMSVIENAARPYVHSLGFGIGDGISDIGTSGQVKLASWMTLFSIAAEYTHEPSAAVNAQERLTFFQRKQPAGNWRIWIAPYIGKNFINRYRHGSLSAQLGRFVLAGDVKPNTQYSLLVLGKLAMYAISTSFDRLDLDTFTLANERCVQIWPTAQDPIRWCLLPPIGDDDCEALAGQFTQRLLTQQLGEPPAALDG